ncbi:MAG: hypothetical protein WC499_02435 [Patescibacteria group bacterium]
MEILKTKEQASIKGEYQFVKLSPKLQDSKIEKEVLPRLRIALRNEDISALEKMQKEGIIESIEKKTNIIPTVGRSVFARRLAGDTTYTGEINYGALGSGTTAFTNASTQLNTEVFRKLASDSSFDDNIAYVDWFIASGDVANATYEEFGAFIDGGAGANSGQAFSLLITGGWVKTGSIFISAKYTIN